MNGADPITLAVLAGGAGSRMGKAKSLMAVNNQPILEFLLDRFRWTGPTLLVTAPGHERPPGCARFDREVVDEVSGQGPLRGVLTSLQNSTTPLVIVAAVDMPLIQHDHLQALLKLWGNDEPVIGLMPGQTAGDSRQIEPFPSIFHRDAAAVIRQRLAEDRRSMRALAKLPSFRVVDAQWERSAWLNLNDPSDLPPLAKLGLQLA